MTKLRHPIQRKYLTNKIWRLCRQNADISIKSKICTFQEPRNITLWLMADATIATIKKHIHIWLREKYDRAPRNHNKNKALYK